MNNDRDNQLYNPRFQWLFISPTYWLTWLAVGFAFLLAFAPSSPRDKFAAWLSKFIARRNSGALRRAKKNIELCFPEMSMSEQQILIEKMYKVAAQCFLGYAEFTFRTQTHNQRRGEVFGGEHLFPNLRNGEKVIALVPHCWAIDYAGMYLASLGYDVAIMVRPQKNLVCDWLMNFQRMRYGGRIISRETGIKPYLRAINDGYIAYYLPDEDHGPEKSVFVPFLGTQKATLRGFGKLVKLTNSKVIPMIPVYNDSKGKYELFVLPELQNFPSGDDIQDARIMNEALEELVEKHPEQYMWILNLLRTRPDGSTLY